MNEQFLERKYSTRKDVHNSATNMPYITILKHTIVECKQSKTELDITLNCSCMQKSLIAQTMITVTWWCDWNS